MFEEYRNYKQVSGVVADTLYEAALTLFHFERLVGKYNSRLINLHRINRYLVLIYFRRQHIRLRIG